jgi:uncharacterized membrane protein
MWQPARGAGERGFIMRDSENNNGMNYQQPQRAGSKNGLKTLLVGIACLIIVVAALVVANTWFIWPTVLGAIAVVAGIVMMVMGK